MPLKHKKGSVMKTSQSRIGGTGSIFTINLAKSAAAMLLLAATTTLRAEPGNDNRAPAVPPSLVVPAGNKVSFHANALGVQIYRATASTNSPTGFVLKLTAPESLHLDNQGNIVGNK